MNVRSQTRGAPTIRGGSSEPMAATKTMTTPLGWTRRWCRRRKRASTGTRAVPTIGQNLLLTLALSCFLIFSGTTASGTGNVTGLDAGPTKMESWAGLGGIGAGAEDIEQILKTLAIAAARAGTGFGAGTGTGWGGAGWRGGRGAGGWGDPDESEGALGGGWGSSTLTLTVWENEPAGTLIGDVSAAFRAPAAGAATNGDDGKPSSPFSADGVHAPSSSSSSSSSSSDPGKVPLDPLAHADGTVRFLVVPADGGDGGDDGGGDITVDVFTGELRTARVLDRETRDRYHFVVLPIAPLLFTASSSSLPLDSPVRVTVRVLDVNDNEPRFGSRHAARGDARHDLYDVGDPGGDDGTKEDEKVRLDISEGVPVGARFSLTPAWDPDEGTHGVQGYTLSDDDDGSETDTKPMDAGSVPTQDDRPRGEQRRRLPFSLEWDVLAERLELVVVLPLDREARPGGYRLRARAHDGGAPARVSRPGLAVRVVLGDENDQAPAFSRRRYGASVREDAALGTSVARVRASDGDQGMNARVRYELDRRLGDPGGFFSVDPRSGVVRLRRRLDFESQHRHELVVVARDGGAPPLSAAAFLSVRVVDVNEHPPLISAILFSRHGSSPRVLVGVVSEDAPLGLIVARVSVHDADLPDPTALPGPPSSPDLVAWPGPPRNDGNDNDHEGEKEEEEEDEESDEASRGNGGDAQPASRDDSQDGGDDSPDGVWDPSGGNGGAGGGRPRLPTTLTLSGGEGVFELLPSASAITASSSSISDAGTAPSPAPHSGTGAAGGTGGSGGVYLLRVSGALDREARGRYRLTLRARDGAWPPLESTAVLDVLVDDVNDNDPVFVPSSSSSDALADVPENAALGTWVARVSASDMDAGENGRVCYAVVGARAAGGDDGTTADGDGRAWECAHTSISSSLSDVGGWFSVDPATGVLSVAGALDHERAPRGVLVTVAASDGGAQPRVTKATLLISIADSNECRPEFRFPGDRELNLSVARSEAMVGKCLGKVVALDGDGGEFGEVRYSLEPAGASAVVPRVASSDAPAASPWLSVGTRSGALCVSRSLGADVSTETFTVRATDKGGLFSETRVRVSLLGDAAGPSRPRGGSPSPDAPPRRGSPGSPAPGPRVTFPRPRLSFSVREDAPVGTPLGTVTGTSAHAGVMYWGAGPFLSVHPTSGLLVTAAPLDRESNPHISARVRASFLGPRSRPGSARPAGEEGDNEDDDNNEEEAVASVSVTVLDVNDNAPRFPSDRVDVRLESPTFDVRGARSGGGGSAVVVLVAVAHDEDAGKHGSVWYSLRGADGRFLVEPRSGVITVAPSALAPGARFAFEVVAQDGGSPALSSSLHVTVSVEPAPPESAPILPSLFFPTPEIRASVPEGAMPGTHVVTLRAFTPFPPAPATASGTQTTTGTGIEIGTAGGIGSDVATGSVSRSNTGTRFESGSRSGAGLRLGAEARSWGGNGTKREQWEVHYSLSPDDAATSSSSSSSPSSWSCFRVDARTGRVTTRCRLDREQSPTLTLTLVARLVPLIPASPTVWPLLSSSPHRHRRRHRAGAEPDIMATARILVSITDDNNHSPVPARDDYFFTVLENDSGGDSTAGGEPGSLVGMVSASDSDSGPGGWVSFAVEHVESPAACGPSPTGAYVSFHVHPTRGEVRAVGLLDREACPWHRVTLRVSDAGAPPRSALCRVHVAVADANDNAPRFLRSQYHAQVETEVPVGTLVATLMAEDPDEGPNGTVVYSLPAGGLGLLLMERDTGRVRTARALTRSDPRSAVLAVRAGDLGNPPRHSGTVLHLTILAVDAIPRTIGDEGDDIDGSDDDNDEEDVPSSVIRLTVPPGTRPGAIIGRVPPPSPSTVATTVFRIISPRQRLHGDDEEEEEGEEVEDDSPFYVDATSGSVFLRRPVAPDDAGSAALPFALDVETVTMGDGRHGDPVVRRVLVLLTVSPSAGERRSPSSSSPPSLPPRFRSTGPVGWVWEDAAPGTPVLIAGPPLSRGLRYSLAYQAPAAASLTDLGYRRQRRGLSGSEIQTFVRNETEQRSKEEMGLGILQNVTIRGRVTAIRPVRQRRSSGPVWTPAGGSGSSGGGGAGTGPFTVDATTGVVRTAAPLDREVAERYLLVVTVVPDGGVEAMGTPVAVANVYVGDVNDVAPIFVWPPPQEPPSHVIVWEGERPGRDLVTLRGRDPDGGMGGRLQFSIAGGNEDGTFFLHPETGVLSLARTPDRETHASYLLRLTISDFGDGLHGDGSSRGDSSRGDSSRGDSQRRLETSTTLTVTVMDVNDQAPRFLPQQERALGESRGSHRSVDDGDVGDGDGATVTYECAVEENAPAGTACVHVTAVDGDEGAGGEVVYTLLGGLVDFSVNERTGLVSTRRPLDRESQHEYTLTVRASDRGTPPCWSLASVVVRVLDRNDNAPLFAAPPHLVAQAHGQRHLDDVDGDDAAAEHDEEEEDDVGGDEAGWRARVSEDSPMGTPVITMVATDADAGENGMVRYHLADGSGSSHFHIDPVTGSLTTAAPLDRETKPRYRLVVEAVDCGPGPPPQFLASGGASSSSSRLPNDGCAGLRSTSIVFVSVLDVNDNSPVFVFGDTVPSAPGSPGPESVERQRTKGPEYRAIVPEGLVAGSPVLWVSAADADSGIRGRVRYRLVGGTRGVAGVTVPPFAIDPESGIVSVAVPRLRAPPERSGSDGGAPDGSVSSTDVPEPHYRLWVEAVDGGRPPQSSRVSALVALVPGSGRAPEFRHGPLAPTLPAGRAAVNALVATVVARDEDGGAGGALAYRLEAGDPHKFFRIDANTGELLVRRPLQGFVGADLAVAAWDHGSPPRAARTVVSVRVGQGPPAGRRAPPGPPLLSFVPTAYEATLPEHSPRDTLVCVVEAAWSDAITRLLTFSILYGNDDGAFSLNANTGRLTVRDPAALDFESIPRRVVIVTARVVLPNATTAGIASDAAAATEGKEGDKMATVAIAAVTVTLRDVNDNAPRFPWQRLAATVRENEPAGTVVTQLVAWDVDGGAGGQLEFALAPGSLSSGFRLDSLTGIITTTASLDREASPVHQLEVWAVDRGRPRLTGSTLVRVTVEDVNDNAPVVAASQHLVVSESVPVGTEIGHILASDPDLYPRLEFSVVERTSVSSSSSVNDETDDVNDATAVAASLLTVERLGGRMTLARPLDFEQRRELALRVRVSDGAHRSDATILITVADDNDNAPSFLRPLYEVSVDERTPPLISLITVAASDRDAGANGRLSYQLVPGSRDGDGSRGGFGIHAMNGSVFLTRPLRVGGGPRCSHYVVEARDAGSPPRSASAALLACARDVNAHAPVFSRAAYAASLPAVPGPRVPVLTVTATDADGSPGDGRVDFTLEAGDPDGLFRLEPVACETYVADAATGAVAHRGTARLVLLDAPVLSGEREEKAAASPERSFELVVSATDRGDPPLSSTATVVVTVMGLEEGKQQPVSSLEFVVPEYRVSLPASAIAGAEVARVLAKFQRDDSYGDDSYSGGGYNDKGAAVIGYQIVAGNRDNLFTVDPRTGAITLRAPRLNRPPGSEVTLVVEAAAALGAVATPSRALVPVHVGVSGSKDGADERDLAAFFSSVELLNASVSENEPAGTRILNFPRFGILSFLYSESHASSAGGNGGKSTGSGLAGRDRDIHAVSPAPPRPLPRPSSSTFASSFCEGAGNFVVEPHTGTVRTSRPLDYEECPRYRLCLTVAPVVAGTTAGADGTTTSISRGTLVGGSGGVGSLVSGADTPARAVAAGAVMAPMRSVAVRSWPVCVHVLVQGADEFAPHFEGAPYRFAVPRGAAAGDTVGRVSASDRDAGPDSTVRYRLAQRSPYFTVNRYTGDIMLKVEPRTQLSSSSSSTSSSSAAISSALRSSSSSSLSSSAAQPAALKLKSSDAALLKVSLAQRPSSSAERVSSASSSSSSSSLSDLHGDETAPPPRWLTLHVEARGPLRGSLSASTAVLVDVRHTAFALVLHGGGGGDADSGTHPPPGATLTLALAASAALAALLLLVLVTAALVCCSRRRRRRRRQAGVAVGQDGPGAEKNLKSSGGGRDGGRGGPDEGMRLKPTRLDGEGGERCSDLPAIARDAEKFLPEEKILACRRGDGGGDSDSDTARDRARRPCVYSITAPYPDEEPPCYSPGTRGPREAHAGSAPTHSPSSATATTITAAVTSCCCCRHGGSDTGGGGGCPDSRAGSGSGSCSCSGSGSASGRGSAETDFGVDAEIRMINEILRASGFSGKSGGPDSSGSCCCGAGTGVGGGGSGVGGGGCCLAPTGCCVSDCCRCRGEADGDVDRPDASQQHRHHHHHHHHGGGGGSGSNAGGHHHHGHHHHHHQQQQQHACRRLPDSGILQDEDQLSDVSRTSRASRDGKSVTSAVTVEATASDADMEPRTPSASTLTRTSLAATTAGGSHAPGREGSGPGLALATDGARRFSSYSSASTLADEAGGTAPLSPSSSSSSATAAAAAGSPPSTASSLRSAFTSAALTPVRKSSAFSEIGHQPHRTAAVVNDGVEDDAQQQQHQQLHLQGGKLGQLLDFGPRFGAMASVFAEIGRLRDENDRPSEAPAAFAVGGAGGVGAARRAVAGMPSERISRDCAKILPPPLITSVAASSARSVPPARPLPYPYARTALLPMPPLVTPPALAGAADEDENPYGGGSCGGGPYPVATLLPSSVPSGAMSPLLSPSLSPLAPPTGAPGSAALAGVVPPYLLPCSAVTPLMIVTGGSGSGASGRGAVSTRGSLDDDDEDDGDDGMEIRI